MLIDILAALAVLVSTGLIFGIILALFIRFFGKEDDQKMKDVRDALPGVNCGACGFRGCNDYAEALCNGSAKPNLCVPGAEDVSKTLGGILGVEVEASRNMVAVVNCNGTCEAVAKKAEYDGMTSCKACALLFAGPTSCRYGCLGCGDCAKVCNSQAISIIDGVAVVDARLCVGCGLCAKECPKKIISIVPAQAAVAVYCSNKDKGADARKACKNACIGCKKCEKACPSQAVTVINNCAVIDHTKCTGCGSCAETCPTGCIKSYPKN